MEQTRFLPPQDSWVADGLGNLAQEIFNSVAFRQRGYWNIEWWQRVLKRLASGENHLAWVLWKPIISEAWHHYFVDVVNGRKRQLAFQKTAK